MVRIDFHLTADKPGYVCRLARKVRAAGKNMVIYSSERRALEELDRSLWTFSETDFLPHCFGDEMLAAETPIILLGRDQAAPHHEVLVNLDREWPPMFSRFERLIEIVGDDEAERAAGRTRWKFYKDRGYPLTKHEPTRAGA